MNRSTPFDASPRSGATLVEVLISIFVMAIGMLALLALFPLGAIRMGENLQDGRTKQCGENASAVAISKNVAFDSAITVTFGDSYLFPDSLGGSGMLAPYPYGPSHPVYIDPLGSFTARTTPYEKWLSGSSGGIARRNTSFTTAARDAIRWFGGLDDILYGTNGMPDYVAQPNPPPPAVPTSAGTFRHNIEYSYAYLVRRPMANDPTVVNLSVAVYRNRPLILAPPGESLPENSYIAELDYATKSNIIRVKNYPVGSGLPTQNPSFPPSVRVGDWLLDTTPTYIFNTTKTPPVPMYQTNRGHFYRIVSITNMDADTVDYEVSPSLRGLEGAYVPATSSMSYPLGTITPGAYLGNIVVLEGVVEVFEKGVVRRRF